MQEVQLVAAPLAALVQRVQQLLEEFPDNPLLGQLLQLAGRIQGVLATCCCRTEAAASQTAVRLHVCHVLIEICFRLCQGSVHSERSQ